MARRVGYNRAHMAAAANRNRVLNAPGPHGHLLRVLGLGFGVAVTIGNTIGAGIFRNAGVVADYLPQTFLFLSVWVIGGLFALIASFSVAELGTMVPRSGGHYVFAHHALGDYPGFVIGWSDWLSNAGSSAAVAIVIGEYLGLLLPGLAPQKTALACGVVVFFAVLQWRGIRTGSGVQNVSSALKALAFLALVGALLLFPGRAPEAHPVEHLPQGRTLWVAMILAMQAVIYTYDGWAGITYFSEEIQDTRRDVPRSMFLGTLAVIGIYLLTSAATIKVLPVTEIRGDVFAIGSAARFMWGQAGDTLLQIVMVVAMLSAINAYQLMTCRIIYSMSVDGLFVRQAANVNAGGTPDFALVLSTLVAVLFIAGGQRFEIVSSIMALFFTCNYIADLISVFVLRRREADRPRAYRAWGYPWTTGIALLGYSAFLVAAVITDWRAVGRWWLLILVFSYPVFLLTKRLKRAAAA